jgi:hypothetical protein
MINSSALLSSKMNKLFTFVFAAAMMSNTFAAAASVDKMLYKEEPDLVVKEGRQLRYSNWGGGRDYKSSYIGNDNYNYSYNCKNKNGGKHKKKNYNYKRGHSSLGGNW